MYACIYMCIQAREEGDRGFGAAGRVCGAPQVDIYIYVYIMSVYNICVHVQMLIQNSRSESLAPQKLPRNIYVYQGGDRGGDQPTCQNKASNYIYLRAEIEAEINLHARPNLVTNTYIKAEIEAEINLHART